jgi:arsenate reductase (glutaredoxin)
MTDDPLVTVYEKPTCTTCKQLRALLEEEGIPFERVNYMIEPLFEPILRDLLRKARLRPRDVLRAKEARDAGIASDDGRSDDEIIGMIVDDPALLQRPIVEMGDRAVLARPIEKVRELLKG